MALNLSHLDAIIRDIYTPVLERELARWPWWLPMSSDPNPFPRFRLWR